jgi:hypothetical protein
VWALGNDDFGLIIKDRYWITGKGLWTSPPLLPKVARSQARRNAAVR